MTNYLEATDKLIIDDLAKMEPALASQQPVNTKSKLTCYTTDQKCVVSLMRILDKMNAPDYALQSILQWAQTSYRNNCNFNPKVQTRNANLQWMRSVIQDADYLLPKEQIIQLDNSTVPVVTFDFATHCCPCYMTSHSCNGTTCVLILPIRLKHILVSVQPSMNATAVYAITTCMSTCRLTSNTMSCCVH